MSEPVQRPSEVTLENGIDRILRLADERFATSALDQRSDEAVNLLLSIGAPEKSRLTFRPQPLDPEMDPYLLLHMEGERVNDANDNSLMNLINDAVRILPAQADEHIARLIGFGELPTHFLTFLDAYHCLLPLMHTDTMRSAVALVYDLIHIFETNMAEIIRSCDALPPARRDIATCSAVTCYSRLLMYRARIRGVPLLEVRREIAQAIQPMRLYGSSVISILYVRLSLTQMDIHELVTGRAAREREWARDQEEPREALAKAVDKVSKPVDAGSDTQECGICYEGGSGSAEIVLTIPCDHAFCKACLRTWLHTPRTNSVTCPMCRTMLLSHPVQLPRVRETSSDRNRVQAEIDELRRQNLEAKQAAESAFWLEEELKLHSRIEAAWWIL